MLLITVYILLNCSGMEGRKENVRQMVNYSPRSKLGTLLPPFPEIKDLNLTDDVDSTKVCIYTLYLI